MAKPDMKALIKDVGDLTQAAMMLQNAIDSLHKSSCKGQKGTPLLDTYLSCTNEMSGARKWLAKMNAAGERVTKHWSGFDQKQRKSQLGKLVWSALMLWNQTRNETQAALDAHGKSTEKWSKALKKVKH